MAIYTRKCEQKSLKINNRGGWNKDVSGEKKIERLTVGAAGDGGGDDYSVLESRFPESLMHGTRNLQFFIKCFATNNLGAH